MERMERNDAPDDAEPTMLQLYYEKGYQFPETLTKPCIMAVFSGSPTTRPKEAMPNGLKTLSPASETLTMKALCAVCKHFKRKNITSIAKTRRFFVD